MPPERGSDAGDRSVQNSLGKQESKVRTCKYCQRTSEEVPWTRGGTGVECKSDAAFVKFNFDTEQERKAYLFD